MDIASLIRRSVVAVIPGVFFGSLFPSWSPLLPALLVSIGIASVSVWPSRRGLIVLLSCLALSSGLFLSAREERLWDRDRPSGSVSGSVTIVGNPETGDFDRKAVVRFDDCLSGELCPRESILVTFPRRTALSYGDTGMLSCPLEPFEKEWRMYYAKDGIAYRCRATSWEKTGESYPVRRAVFGFSERFGTAVSRALTEPEAGLALGLLLGGSRRLAPAVVDDFRSAGLSHIVAVSGYNISIVAEGFLLLGIAFSLRRTRAIPFSLAATAIFVLVSGAPSSAVRAFGMASAAAMAVWLGRRYASLRAIVFVAGVMLLLHPLSLRHDIGFLLSFAAAAGITLSSPWIGRVVDRVRYGGFFVEAALLTFSANLFVMPIIFANFGSFSPISFLANAALLPIVPYAMLFSFLSGLSGMVFPWLGGLFAFPAYATVHPIVSGAEWMARLSPLTTISVEFGWVVSIAWYALLFLVLGGLYLARDYLGGYPEGRRSFWGFVSFIAATMRKRLARRSAESLARNGVDTHP